MHAIDPSIKRGITPAIHRATPRAIHPARVVLHWLLTAMSVTAGLGQVVFGGVGNLPARFDAFTARTVHGIVAKVLLVLVVVHVAAALYHQWICRQGALQRMGLRRRRPGEAA